MMLEHKCTLLIMVFVVDDDNHDAGCHVLVRISCSPLRFGELLIAAAALLEGSYMRN